MQRKTTYKCDNCGQEFANRLECEQHEKDCHNRKYLIEQLKARLRKYIQSIEVQGFEVSINYHVTPSKSCLIAITDKKGRKK